MSPIGARRAVVLAVIGNAAAPLIGFASIPILARSLGADGRGQYAAITAPMLLALGLLTLGIPEALTVFTAKRGRVGRAWRHAALILGLISIAGGALIVLLRHQLLPDDPQAYNLLLIATCALGPSLLISSIRGYAMGMSLWGLVLVERALGPAIRLIGFVSLGLLGNLTLSAAIVVFSLSMVAPALAYAPAFFYRARRLDEDAHVLPTRQLFKFSLSIWFGAAAGILLSRADQVLVAPLSSTLELSFYVTAVSISELTLVFNNAIRDVLLREEADQPSLSRLARATRLSTALTIVLSTIVALISYWAIPILFGEDFAAAYIPTLILLVGIVLGNAGSIAGSGLVGRGRPSLRSWSLLLGLSVNLISLALLVPPLGAIGASLSTVVGNIIAGYMNVYWLKKHYGARLADFLLVLPQDFVEALQIALARAISRKVG